MAELKTIQDRIEDIAKEKLQAKINAVKEAIYKAGLRGVLDKIAVVVDNRTISIDDLFNGYEDKALYKKAAELLLPDMINTEVSAFINKVDSLQDQVEELKFYQGGQY